jgi:hypothetical protein
MEDTVVADSLTVNGLSPDDELGDAQSPPPAKKACVRGGRGVPVRGVLPVGGAAAAPLSAQMAEAAPGAYARAALAARREARHRRQSQNACRCDRAKTRAAQRLPPRRGGVAAPTRDALRAVWRRARCAELARVVHATSARRSTVSATWRAQPRHVATWATCWARPRLATRAGRAARWATGSFAKRGFTQPAARPAG